MSGRANNTTRTEIAIVGGGLAGGLIALALRQARPDVAVHLYEAGPALGGNHRWSWFDSDLDTAGNALLAPFRKIGWQGYEVRFPAYQRKLKARYNSLSSADFEPALRRELGQDTIRTGTPVAALDAGGIILADGTRVSARAVIDCRDMATDSTLRGGWQVFMGRHFRTPRPHGLAQPIVMDARVDQHGAYRFVYVLPLGADELFVEDTYYADSPELDRSALSARIDRYCESQGWDGTILHGEAGVLPVITGGDFAAWQRAHAIDGVARAGAGGGFVHPLTSYTLPFAVETALAIAADADLPGEQLAALLADRARRHWAQTGFYRALGRMLFDAAKPDERYRVFQRFYRLRQPLIERFYAARSTTADKARILCGKPPVSILRALSALAGQSAPLRERHRP
ncbi:MAG: lycopene cyclase [Erythrobacter sp. 34-65-8]|nr:MAG: lycopene cyclase [Erythrobacter sp. 34-65-8]